MLTSSYHYTEDSEGLAGLLKTIRDKVVRFKIVLGSFGLRHKSPTGMKFQSTHSPNRPVTNI